MMLSVLVPNHFKGTMHINWTVPFKVYEIIKGAQYGMMWKRHLLEEGQCQDVAMKLYYIVGSCEVVV